MKDKKEKSVETSDFLKNLQKAVTTGNKEIVSDVVERINTITKIADNLNGDDAFISIEKRIEKVGAKDILTPEERNVLTIKEEKENLRIKEEEDKLRMISQINNSEHELSKSYKELEEIKDKFKKIILSQESEISNLKTSFKEKYNEKYDGI